MKDFELVSGSATGASHIEEGKNNQDTFSVRHNAASIVAAVADGCSSQPYSEVGAWIVVAMVTNFITQALRKGLSLNDVRVRRNIRERLLSRILLIADDMAGDEPTAPILNAFFQFTILGVAVTPETTFFFRIGGDGLHNANGEVRVVHPERGNRPAYLVYALTGSPMTDDHPELTDFQILRTVPTSDVKSFWIGTDGVSELLAAVGQTANGELVASVDEILGDNRYYDNPGLLSRRLRQLVIADYIGDDVTLIGGRRVTLPDPSPVAGQSDTQGEAPPTPGKEMAAQAAGTGPDSTGAANTALTTECEDK